MFVEFSTGPYRKKDSAREDKGLMLDKAQDQLNHLTREIAKLKSEQQELDEVIECLKNKVCIQYANLFVSTTSLLLYFT